MCAVEDLTLQDLRLLLDAVEALPVDAGEVFVRDDLAARLRVEARRRWEMVRRLAGLPAAVGVVFDV